MLRPNPILYGIRWRDEVGRFLNERGLTGSGVEIGSFEGAYAHQVLSGTSNYGRWKDDPDWAWKGHLTCIDLWEKQPDEVYIDSKNSLNLSVAHDKAEARLAPFKASLLKASSLDAAQSVSDASLDWIYIDANHAYAAAGNDIAVWYPKLKPGGLFSGHDFYTCHKADHPDPRERCDSDVALAVLEFAEKIGIWPYVTACRSWWFIKP